MARTTHRLTALKAASIKAKGLHADGNGLYLSVTATGTKSWIYRYATEGRLRDMGLGSYASITLAQARSLAAEADANARRAAIQYASAKARRNAQRNAIHALVLFVDAPSNYLRRMR